MNIIILHFTHENTDSTRDYIRSRSQYRGHNWILKHRSVYKACVHSLTHMFLIICLQYYVLTVYDKNSVYAIIQNCPYLDESMYKKKRGKKQMHRNKSIKCDPSSLTPRNDWTWKEQSGMTGIYREQMRLIHTILVLPSLYLQGIFSVSQKHVHTCDPIWSSQQSCEVPCPFYKHKL